MLCELVLPLLVTSLTPSLSQSGVCERMYVYLSVLWWEMQQLEFDLLTGRPLKKRGFTLASSLRTRGESLWLGLGVKEAL